MKAEEQKEEPQRLSDLIKQESTKIVDSYLENEELLKQVAEA